MSWAHDIMHCIARARPMANRRQWATKSWSTTRLADSFALSCQFMPARYAVRVQSAKIPLEHSQVCVLFLSTRLYNGSWRAIAFQIEIFQKFTSRQLFLYFGSLMNRMSCMQANVQLSIDKCTIVLGFLLAKGWWKQTNNIVNYFEGIRENSYEKWICTRKFLPWKIVYKGKMNCIIN